MPKLCNFVSSVKHLSRLQPNYLCLSLNSNFNIFAGSSALNSPYSLLQKFNREPSLWRTCSLGKESWDHNFVKIYRTRDKICL